MKTQEEKNVSKHLVAEVSTLLQTSPERVKAWRGTMLDLMEAVHEAYVTGKLLDERGNPQRFNAMVRQACLCIGRKPIRNGGSAAAAARRRKGLRALPFMTRYTYLLYKNPQATPLLDLLELRENNTNNHPEKQQTPCQIPTSC